VNRVKWVPSGCGSGGGAGSSAFGAHHHPPRLLLSTNDKTVKLWRVAERAVPTLAAGFDANTGAALSSAAVAAASLRGGGGEAAAGTTSCGAPAGVSPSTRPAAWTIAASSRAGEPRAPPPPSATSPSPRRGSKSLGGLGGKDGGAGGKAGGADEHPSSPSSSSSAPSLPYTLAIPRVVALDSVLTARCRRTFAGAHAYHVNSLSLCSDGETFLSADDLRVHLWHLDRPSAGAWVLVDLKPPCMEDLTEVITAAEFHPTDCAAFVYASSKGALRLADMRAAALCDRPALTLAPPDGPAAAAAAATGTGGPTSAASPTPSAPPAAPRSFFSEIVASVSDVRFVGPSGRALVARDYMGLSLWDLAQPRAPVATYPVHDGLRSRLADLYENDCIFDKFGVAVAGDGSGAATGTYSSLFRVVPAAGDGGGGGSGGFGGGGGATTSATTRRAPPGALLEASRDPQRLMRGVGGGCTTPTLRPARGVAWPNSAAAPAFSPGGGGGSGGGSGGNGPPPADPGADPAVVGADLTAKMLHLAWHPRANVLAAAACNSLYLYHAA
jgi:hypothetical protein